MAIKTRTKKTSPNTAGTQRRLRQEGQAEDNRDTVFHGGRTRWQISCDKRRAKRLAAGKGFQWEKKQKYNASKLAAVK